MYQYICNSRCYQRYISIFIIIGVTRDIYQYIYNSRCYLRCISIFIIGVTKDVSVYL